MLEYNITYEDFPKAETNVEGIQVKKVSINGHEAMYIKDVVYANHSNVDLLVQMLVPIGRKAEDRIFPTIVYVPGSGWLEQNIYQKMPRYSQLVLQGHVVAIVQYRHMGIAKFPAQIEDVKSAIRFLKKNCEKYSIDPDKIVLWGDSSGGHTALMAGITADDAIMECDDNREYSCKVKGIVDYYGVVNIAKLGDYPTGIDHISAASREGMLIGGHNIMENPELIKPTVVTNYVNVDKEICPIMIFHGNKDRAVCFEQSVELYQCLKQNNKEVQMYCLDDAEHGGSAFWSEEIIKIVLDFVEKVTE